jgi:Xaa-Pro aminopeptidase
MNTREKIEALRQLMQQHNIDAWIVPSADPHQSEYVAACWKTRAWLSGFSGSAGTLVVAKDKAGLWTDSRYFLQAEQELEGSGIELFKMKMPGVPTYTEWLSRELENRATIGFDGNVLSVAQVEELKTALEAKNIQLAYQQDLVAQLWKDRPEIPAKPVSLLDVKFAGESRISKFARIREKIKGQGAHAHLISTLDEIAWIFNIRGSDVEYNPVTISYAYISEEEARVFIKPEKVSTDVRTALNNDGAVLSEYEEIIPYLQQLPKGTTILIDPQKTTQTIKDAISPNCTIKEAPNIAFKLKAMKNETELDGIRKAHIRDGVAMVKWLYWLDQHLGKEEYTEVTIVESLEKLRSQGKYFQGLSFNTIAGYQTNGAICHYKAKPETALTIRPEGILLIDSGAQYLDGTTDITRTLALSEPTPEQRQDFTLVLKGHIALATAKFPKGTTGAQLDTFARATLWQHGLNYGHGTGHGIGHFLNVHEGPQSIRPDNYIPIEPGMLCSNEPGLYRVGRYGIRIENLIITVPAEETEFGTFYCFETVTLCPIDLEFVDVSLLTLEERTWLNTYHKSVYEKLSPLLTDDEKAWLRYETREI